MKAVVFDLDGVVVDTEKYWNKAEETIYQKATGEKVKTDELAGMTISNTYEYLSENYKTEVNYEEFFQMYEDHAETIYKKNADLMPRFKELAEELKEKGLKVGVATGSYWADYAIERFDLDFDAKSDSNMTEGNGKPDPETYLIAVKKLDVEPEEAVAVEDTDAGIKSAKSAGLYCIGYEGSDGQSLEQADETVNGPEELRTVLLESQIKNREEPPRE
ncbi:MAG: HAD superfamily hydrolase (TIGR01509 family) [Colwellia polaris]|jgi:HAD superfamily hydrolase (TIGR01509 family)